MRRRRLVATATLAVALGACGSDGDSGPAQPVQLEPSNPTAGCGPVVRFPDEGARHVAQGTEVSYGTQPPTSGDHLGIVGATGTYAKEIPDEVQVHNLEHGHVLIQYVPGRLPKEVLDGLVAVARADVRWVLLAPRSAARFVPDAALAFTAWRTLQACETPGAAAVDEARAFVERYRRHGREEVPGDPVRETPPPA